MTTFFAASIVIVPIGMMAIAAISKPLSTLFDIIALISYYSVGTIIAHAVYITVTHGTTFTTYVHGILLNPWLLFPGAYLGLYLPYLILIRMWSRSNRRTI